MNQLQALLYLTQLTIVLPGQCPGLPVSGTAYAGQMYITVCTPWTYIWFTRGTTVWADVQYGLHPLDIWFNRHTTVWADVHYSLYPLDIWFNRGTTVWADVHYGLNCHVIFGPPEIFCPPGPNISGKLKYLVWGDWLFQILLEIFGPPLKYLFPPISNHWKWYLDRLKS